MGHDTETWDNDTDSVMRLQCAALRLGVVIGRRQRRTSRLPTVKKVPFVVATARSSERIADPDSRYTFTVKLAMNSQLDEDGPGASCHCTLKLNAAKKKRERTHSYGNRSD